MTRTAPNRPSRRRDSEAAARRQQPSSVTNTASASTSTPSRSYSNSTNNTSGSASLLLGCSPIVPTPPSHAAEMTRASGVLSALELPTRRREILGAEQLQSSSVTEQSQSEISRLEEQLKAFFDRQEAFNKRMEERESQRRPEKAATRLPRHLTVRSFDCQIKHGIEAIG